MPEVIEGGPLFVPDPFAGMVGRFLPKAVLSKAVGSHNFFFDKKFEFAIGLSGDSSTFSRIANKVECLTIFKIAVVH